MLRLLTILLFFSTTQIWAVDSVSINVNNKPPQNEITIFPNPVMDYLEVKNPKNTANITEIKIYNIIGEEIKKFKVTQNSRYKISDLKRGFYLVSFVSDDNQIIKTIRIAKK